MMFKFFKEIFGKNTEYKLETVSELERNVVLKIDNILQNGDYLEIHALTTGLLINCESYIFSVNLSNNIVVVTDKNKNLVYDVIISTKNTQNIFDLGKNVIRERIENIFSQVEDIKIEHSRELYNSFSGELSLETE